MKLSARQAAQKTGKSIPTITRAIKSGKLSATKTGSGGYEIEASELFRVFRVVTEAPNVKDNTLGNETPSSLSDDTPGERALREKIELLEAALSDAKTERDEWREQAKRLALARPSPEEPTAVKKGFWARLTNR